MHYGVCRTQDRPAGNHRPQPAKSREYHRLAGEPQGTEVDGSEVGEDLSAQDSISANTGERTSPLRGLTPDQRGATGRRRSHARRSRRGPTAVREAVTTGAAASCIASAASRRVSQRPALRSATTSSLTLKPFGRRGRGVARNRSTSSGASGGSANPLRTSSAAAWSSVSPGSQRVILATGRLRCMTTTVSTL